MSNELFTGGNEKPEIKKEEVIQSLRNIKGEPTPKDLEILFSWHEQEEKKCTNSLMLLKVNFEVAKIYLLAGLRNEAIDAFTQADDEAYNEQSDEANTISSEAAAEFEKLLDELDKK